MIEWFYKVYQEMYGLEYLKKDNLDQHSRKQAGNLECVEYFA